LRADHNVALGLLVLPTLFVDTAAVLWENLPKLCVHVG
jgi:hypothetical protein